MYSPVDAKLTTCHLCDLPAMSVIKQNPNALFLDQIGLNPWILLHFCHFVPRVEVGLKTSVSVRLSKISSLQEYVLKIETSARENISDYRFLEDIVLNSILRW